MNDAPVKSRMPWWKMALTLTWILVQVTLILAIRNRNVTEFIYAGF